MLYLLEGRTANYRQNLRDHFDIEEMVLYTDLSNSEEVLEYLKSTEDTGILIVKDSSPTSPESKAVLFAKLTKFLIKICFERAREPGKLIYLAYNPSYVDVSSKIAILADRVYEVDSHHSMEVRRR